MEEEGESRRGADGGQEDSGRASKGGGRETREEQKRGPSAMTGEEGRGPLYDPGGAARLVGKWVYKRGPGDSISTHDPTFTSRSPTERTGSPGETSLNRTRAK